MEIQRDIMLDIKGYSVARYKGMYQQEHTHIYIHNYVYICIYMRCVSPKMDGSNGQTAQLMGLPEDLGYRHPLAETQNLKVVKLVILGYTYMILDTI